MVIKYLEKMRQELYESILSTQTLICKNEQELRETIQFIYTLESSLEDNFDAFSPWDTHHESRQKIEELKREQESLEQQSNELKVKISDMNSRMAELESVIRVARQQKKYIQEKETVIAEDEIFRNKVLETQELERQRIARDLHDSIVQSLTNLVHKVEICYKLMDIDSIRCKMELKTMSKNVREIIQEMRGVIYNLRPMSLDDIGLDVTLERELSKIKYNSGIQVNYLLEGENSRISPIVSLTILRIVQEACNNIVKHARATELTVKLKYADSNVIVEIEDNGIGFDVERVSNRKRKDDSGFGIPMMRERVYLLSGKFQIDSKIGKGTRIKVKVPIRENVTYNKLD